MPTSYQTKPPFSGWAGPHQARIVAIAEAWGADESSVGGRPLVGAAGKEFWRMLGEAWPDESPALWHRAERLQRFGLGWVREREPWLEATALALTNVFNFRPSEDSNDLQHITEVKALAGLGGHLSALSKGRYLQARYLPELDRLFEELRQVRPNLVLCLGNTACWALLRTTNISSLRGTVTQLHPEVAEACGGQLKVLPTFHPAGLLYEGQWSRRPIMVSDLMKAQRESQFPEIRRPRRRIIADPELAEFVAWVEYTIKYPPTYLAIDTETSLGMIDTISFARSRSDGIVVQLGPHRKRIGQRFETTWPRRNGTEVVSYWSEAEEVEFWRQVGLLLAAPISKLFQNGLYDLQYLVKLGFKIDFSVGSEDTMLLHHSLFPEMKKGLGFLGSIYTPEPAWKLMRRERADTIKRDE